jgi:hypothetical protein
MFTTAPPMAVYQRDSARVENRGPSTTTIVPPSVTAMSDLAAVASTVARPVGQYGSANDTCTAPSS